MKRVCHYPIWDKDGLPFIKITPEENILICEMEYGRYLNNHLVKIYKCNGNLYLSAIEKLFLLYKKYKRNFNFIKAYKLKKNLKIYGIEFSKGKKG